VQVVKVVLNVKSSRTAEEDIKKLIEDASAFRKMREKKRASSNARSIQQSG